VGEKDGEGFDLLNCEQFTRRLGRVIKRKGQLLWRG
jgi:hypothetical protein